MAKISSIAVTDTGLRRESNVDSFRERPDLGLYVVADGMGGHAAGEVASEMAATLVAQNFTPSPGMSDDELMDALRELPRELLQELLDEKDGPRLIADRDHAAAR